MLKEDVAQVTGIDREAFPTQLPPPNYHHELQNKLAHYIVICDDDRTVEAPEMKPQPGLPGVIHRIRRWLKRDSPPGDKPAPPKQPYIVGFAGIWLMADEAHITNIAVRRQYQRQGLGELLLIHTADLAKEVKASTMTLEVRVSNITAQNLYSKYGFVRAGIRRGYYLDNREDAIIMSTESIASAPFQAHLQQLRADLARKWGSHPSPGSLTTGQ
jgi:ribosomal-protein-alanine N-acetyltransferase